MSAFSCNRSFPQAEFRLSTALPLEVTLWRSRTTMPARHFEYTLLMAFVALASVARSSGRVAQTYVGLGVVYQGGKPTTGAARSVDGQLGQDPAAAGQTRNLQYVRFLIEPSWTLSEGPTRLKRTQKVR